MKNRKALGRDCDICETTALVAPDPFATERIFDACDWEQDSKARGGRIASALRRLPIKKRRFAQAVLKGKTWREIGLSKSQFNRELKNILDFLNP